MKGLKIVLRPADGRLGFRRVVVGPVRRIECSCCGKLKSSATGFYLTPEGTPRGRKCRDCVRESRIEYHERKKKDPKYVKKMRAESLRRWLDPKKHESNLAAQRERDKRRRGKK